MKPWKPHWVLRIWVSVYGLAVDGTPLRASNADITEPTPASTAALKGGRYRFHRRWIYRRGDPYDPRYGHGGSWLSTRRGPDTAKGSRCSVFLREERLQPAPV